MASLAEIRAKLSSMETKPGSKSQSQGDNAIYPHWNIDEGTSAVFKLNAGVPLAIRPSIVKATGTTATGIVALY